MPQLQDVIGNFTQFIDGILGNLRACGLDPVALGYEMDHICYRCESEEEYHAVCGALVPSLGRTLVETEIGGRLMATGE